MVKQTIKRRKASVNIELLYQALIQIFQQKDNIYPFIYTPFNPYYCFAIEYRLSSVDRGETVSISKM